MNTMKTTKTVLGAALVGSFLSAVALAASELIELRPVAATSLVPTRVMDFAGVPEELTGTAVKAVFALDPAGAPQDIAITGVRSRRLAERMAATFARWRFQPVPSAKAAPAARYELPLLLLDHAPTSADLMQAGALGTVAISPPARTKDDLNEHPAMYHANAIELDGGLAVADGASDSAVRARLGRPDRIVGDVWAYGGFRGNCENADRHGCRTVLVSFVNHRVSAIALVNELGREFAEAQLQVDPHYLDRALRDLHQATVVAQN